MRSYKAGEILIASHNEDVVSITRMAGVQICQAEQPSGTGLKVASIKLHEEQILKRDTYISGFHNGSGPDNTDKIFEAEGINYQPLSGS